MRGYLLTLAIEKGSQCIQVALDDALNNVLHLQQIVGDVPD